MNVHLDTDKADLIRHGLASGRYKNADEMIGRALELLENPEERQRFDMLLIALEEGLEQAERGELVDLDLQNLIKEVREIVFVSAESPG